MRRRSVDDLDATVRAYRRCGDDGTHRLCDAALPRIELARAKLEPGVPLFEVLVAAGLATTKSAARKLIRGGGARVNDTVVKTETEPVTVADINADGVIKISAGRKRHALVQPV